MEVSLLPSKFLNVGSEKSNKRENVINFSIPPSLSSALSIPPICKKVNGNCSYYEENSKKTHLINGLFLENEFINLRKRLPRTVLEECIVEFASATKKIDKMPMSTEDAIIILPMYQNKTMAVTENQSEKVSLRDIFNRVEAVYSDDEESEYVIEAKSSAQLANSISYTWDKCSNNYSNEGTLWQHNIAARSVEKSCECQLCGRKFHRNCSLALHMKCHSDELNCSCKICGKEFSRLSMLERHMKIHNGTHSHPVVCKICSKKFNDDTSLKAHILTHNEKFSCEQCNVTFNTKQLLDLHFHITHKLGETPFACKICKARFSNLRELNEHSVLHSHDKLSIPCHNCGEVFSQRCTYKKHLQLHMGRRLSCSICRIDFTQRSSLLRHYKRLHLINDIPASVTVGVVHSSSLLSTKYNPSIF